MPYSTWEKKRERGMEGGRERERKKKRKKAIKIKVLRKDSQIITISR